MNGSTIASTADGVYKGWHRTYNLTDDTYTFSMFVKYYNSQWISIYRIGQAISRFDVKNGVFGNNPSNLKSVNYGNGWYRLEFTFTAASGTNWLYIYPSSNSGENSSNGDGLYIWGGQLEQGSYATSYIPTSGSAVTRTVEYSKIINSPILQATNQFTLFFDAPKFLEVNGGVGNFDNIMLNLGAGEGAYDSGTGIHIYNKVWYYFNGSSSSINIGICYNSLTDSKFAISYDGTSFHKYANGVKLGTYTLSASMVNWDSIQTGGMDDAQDDERTWT